MNFTQYCQISAKRITSEEMLARNGDDMEVEEGRSTSSTLPVDVLFAVVNSTDFAVPEVPAAAVYKNRATQARMRDNFRTIVRCKQLDISACGGWRAK